MATLTSYDNLQTEIASHIERSGINTTIENWIDQAESWLNRKLGAVEDSQALTGTADQNYIDTSSYSIVKPLSLYLTTYERDRRLHQVSFANLVQYDSSSEPSDYAWDKNDQRIWFDAPLDQAHTFRLHYRQRFALSDSATTNWLLDNHPDLYYAATMMYAMLYYPTEGLPSAAEWRGLARGMVAEVRREIAENKATTASMPPGMPMGSGVYNIESDEVV